jgi:heptosyltransferase-2
VSAPGHIVVRGVNWLGDAVMSLPALRRIREAWPHAAITLVTPRKLGGLWAGSPFVDATLEFGPRESLWSIGRRLRSGNYDLGVIFPNSPRSALELWRGGVRRRVGLAASWRSIFLTQIVPRYPGFEPMRKRSVAEVQRLVLPGAAPASGPSISGHHLHHYLHIAAAAGASPEPAAPRIPVSEDEAAGARTEFGIPADRRDAPLLGLNAGAEYGPAKRWPVENFIAAARELRKWTGCVWIIFGGAADTGIAAEIERGLGEGNPVTHGSPVINLAGRTSLRQLCAVMRSCRVVVTNDTGPMHLAAAVGTTVVAIFGSTSPELTGPGLPGDTRHRFLRAGAPCSPCFLRECPIDLRCLRGLAPGAVVEAVLSTLW